MYLFIPTHHVPCRVFRILFPALNHSFLTRHLFIPTISPTQACPFCTPVLAVTWVAPAAHPAWKWTYGVGNTREGQQFASLSPWQAVDSGTVLVDNIPASPSMQLFVHVQVRIDGKGEKNSRCRGQEREVETLQHLMALRGEREGGVGRRRCISPWDTTRLRVSGLLIISREFIVETNLIYN
jgi:hypothetical protein